MAYKPKPFKRPSIEIGAVRRRWIDVPVEWVSGGDNVRGLGVVERVEHDLYSAHLTFTDGKVSSFEHGYIIHAFTFPEDVRGNGI